MEILGLSEQEYTFTHRANVCKKPRIDCGREDHPLGAEQILLHTAKAELANRLQNDVAGKIL